jgi:hypothetical protein
MNRTSYEKSREKVAAKGCVYVWDRLLLCAQATLKLVDSSDSPALASRVGGPMPPHPQPNLLIFKNVKLTRQVAIIVQRIPIYLIPSQSFLLLLLLKHLRVSCRCHGPLILNISLWCIFLKVELLLER